MNQRILFLSEKPMQAKALSFLMKDNDKVILAQNIVSYKFDYQELKYSEAPYTNEEPKYKFIAKQPDIFHTSSFNNEENMENCPFLKKFFKLKKFKFSSEEEKIELLKEYFSQFNEIVFACDMDHTGYRHFHFKFAKYFELGENWGKFFDELNIKITGMKITCYDKKTLKECFENREPFFNNPFFENLKTIYLKKDFFEYNYNLNSILFFNEAMRLSGYVKYENYNVLTKNYIATLFFIQNESLKEHEVVSKMVRHHVGSSSTMAQIIENLKLMNLVKYKEYNLSLTEFGATFLTLLHKKVNDPYLNIRILQNNYRRLDDLKAKEREKANFLSLEEFKDKYSKYLYTVFSKQKRFLRKSQR